jgi:hypothetical protein
VHSLLLACLTGTTSTINVNIPMLAAASSAQLWHQQRHQYVIDLQPTASSVTMPQPVHGQQKQQRQWQQQQWQQQQQQQQLWQKQQQWQWQQRHHPQAVRTVLWLLLLLLLLGEHQQAVLAAPAAAAPAAAAAVASPAAAAVSPDILLPLAPGLYNPSLVVYQGSGWLVARSTQLKWDSSGLKWILNRAHLCQINVTDWSLTE